MKKSTQLRLSAGTLAIGMAIAAQPVFAQDADEGAEAETSSAIIVTGSRIVRPNLESPSPVAVVTGDETVEQADITLETYLNTLPQVNPAGTSTSNNPGNGGQSNINLRGLGANRNLVLLNGRRPMVSDSSQRVDINTIPQGLIERVEIVTGGAGAVYGADALAGVTNFILKDDFEGVDLRATYSNVLDEWDGKEYQFSGTIGGNFADGRGNMAISVEHSSRQALLKGQRGFAAQATSTTGTFPTGSVRDGSNPFAQSAIDALFLGYGSAPKDIPVSGTSKIAFNTDGSLFGVGIFNSPVDVTNFRDGVDSAANPNLNYFPDFYTYNFDIINYLVLPYERTSAFLTGHYEISPAVEVFVQGSWVEYTSATALAPTPIGTRVESLSGTNPTRAKSALIEPGRNVTALLVPVTNPFIPADLATLLASRTGNDANIVGSGATEAFTIAKRFLPTGLRQQNFNNEVIQGLIGLRGEIAPGWRYEIYASKGRTTQDVDLDGNVDVQKVQNLLEAADGGASLCTGGFNPFGAGQPFSQSCIDYVSAPASTTTKFNQEIYQAYIAGNVTELPAGPLSIVLGAEQRKFDYFYDAGSLSGPIAGFNTGTNDKGTNKFTDFFGEVNIPLVSDSFVQYAELSLLARNSKSDFNDIQNGIDGESQSDWTYGATFTADVNDSLRVRGSYQRAVRAPNFGELFSGGGSFPQYFDPCSTTSNFRQSGGAAARQLCIDAAAFGTNFSQSAVDAYAQTPGSQVFLGYTGNTDLKPEKGTTFTLGTVFNAFGFTGSLDYYNIKVTDAILQPDPNILIAACFGLLPGTNDSLSASSPYCGGSDGGFFRVPDILQIVLPSALGGDASGYFTFQNQGKFKTSGLDFQLAYNLPTEFIGPESSIGFNLMVNYLIDYKVEELPGVTIDYADTASYFGAGLGTSFPRWRANLQTDFRINENIKLDTRIRYIDGMKNRAAVQYVGETFTGPGTAVYVDTALEFKVDPLTFRVGVNNLFDRGPEEYAPNSQSGTDPSLYDIYGRRVFVSGRIRF
ncbi:TonB-dependent receptor [Altererythrobacter sp. BO-6]|uniref:TonB-dependent receptor domain-containing protein n=1 Tax=Altererythrobacter sp. BO-6 TaxID=2604537 RepID=UPI0013E140FE|nr:TonB-dependent receptor [Altererythrobacter sp. BO-6]QIG54839.1 TonB-dependent receptor [Altererythrobacter sp. BO-6]